ncbi:6-phospho-3-hexuloisomerase [Methanofollis ethanolicus]|uniref:6-phospho-3-hexuloisomerase n=1 Tax=Methanofollis ethanolicus TaxID=488124 RepID=UPI000829F9A4|nr:6-phospho-3-hexuloisomerase [Methanofollis ethanolicus]
MPEGCYSIADLMLLMTDRIGETARVLDDTETSAFVDAILAAQRIYVVGAGRSGLVARAFAMRLMHLGMESYVVGETITPALQEGDLLVAFSGSGETHSIVEFCATAQALGGLVCLLTATPDSTLGRIAEIVVDLGVAAPPVPETPGQYEVRQLTGQYRSVSPEFAPFGTLFEMTSLIFSDAVLSALMELKHCSLDEIKGRISNIQ